MKRYIKSSSVKQQYFIVWFREGDDEDYAVIPAKNIEQARDQAESMFGEDVVSVQFYQP